MFTNVLIKENTHLKKKAHFLNRKSLKVFLNKAYSTLIIFLQQFKYDEVFFKIFYPDDSVIYFMSTKSTG